MIAPLLSRGLPPPWGRVGVGDYSDTVSPSHAPHPSPPLKGREFPRFIRRPRIHEIRNGAGNPAIKRALIIAILAVIGLALLAAPALAQQISVDLGEDGTLTGRVVQLIIVVTLLSLAPSILVMTTSFVRIVVVLSLLRTAMGLQQSPPNSVIVSLSLFLTAFVMWPVFQQSWETGVQPLMEQQMELSEGAAAAAEPIKMFMIEHTRDEDLVLFFDLADQDIPETAQESPFWVVAPAFMISELRRAFEIGFLLFIPFLVIDLVVASILMSMGMMMLPPVIISLPFKLIFFVLVDGWRLVAGSLVESFQ